MRDTATGQMLTAVIADLADRIGERRPAALADEPDAVHRLRTAVRRLRNVLAAFAPLLDPASVGGLRAQLATYGDRLGRARDLEVRAEWAGRVADLAGIPEDARQALVLPLLAEHQEAHAALVAWSTTLEADDLDRTLREWAHRPSLVDGAARPAEAVAREVLAAQVQRTLELGSGFRVDQAGAHALRKAARRLRHVADAVTKPPAVVLGEEAAALGELGSRIQSLLGDHRDALLLVEHVRSVPTEDDGVREAYRLVVARAEQTAAEAIGAVPEVIEALREQGVG